MCGAELALLVQQATTNSKQNGRFLTKSRKKSVGSKGLHVIINEYNLIKCFRYEVA
jgi:hypothetical protein